LRGRTSSPSCALKDFPLFLVGCLGGIGARGIAREGQPGRGSGEEVLRPLRPQYIVFVSAASPKLLTKSVLYMHFRCSPTCCLLLSLAPPPRHPSPPSRRCVIPPPKNAVLLPGPGWGFHCTWEGFQGLRCVPVWKCGRQVGSGSVRDRSSQGPSTGPQNSRGIFFLWSSLTWGVVAGVECTGSQQL